MKFLIKQAVITMFKSIFGKSSKMDDKNTKLTNKEPKCTKCVDCGMFLHDDTKCVYCKMYFQFKPKEEKKPSVTQENLINYCI